MFTTRGGRMRSRSTAVAASTNPITTAVHSALLALALVGVAAAVSACAPAAAKTTNAAASAIPVVAQPISLSARGWSATASGIVQANASVDVAFQVPGK